MIAVLKAPPLRQRVHQTDRLAHLALIGSLLLLSIGLVAPLLLILSRALDGVPWAEPAAAWLASASPAARALAPWAEGATVLLGLLSPCLLAFAVARPGWRRAGLALGVLCMAALATTLSTVLNFGPEHAMAWRTPVTLGAYACALALLLAGTRRLSCPRITLTTSTAKHPKFKDPKALAVPVRFPAREVESK